jgi:hypothetical protein
MVILILVKTLWLSHSKLTVVLISFQAHSGTEGARTLRLRGYLQDKEIFLLVDSGCSHSFISEHMASFVSPWQPLSHIIQVRVANGACIPCTQLPDQVWGCQGHTFTTTMKILPLSSYDVILGMDWLGAHSPMHIHWEQRWIQLTHQSKEITLQGIQPGTILGPPVSQHQLKAMHKIGSILYLVQLNVAQAPTSAPSQLPDELQTILHQFDSVFAPPSELPPRRPGDHKIPLLDGA